MLIILLLFIRNFKKIIMENIIDAFTGFPIGSAVKFAVKKVYKYVN